MKTIVFAVATAMLCSLTARSQLVQPTTPTSDNKQLIRVGINQLGFSGSPGIQQVVSGINATYERRIDTALSLGFETNIGFGTGRDAQALSISPAIFGRYYLGKYKSIRNGGANDLSGIYVQARYAYTFNRNWFGNEPRRSFDNQYGTFSLGVGHQFFIGKHLYFDVGAGFDLLHDGTAIQFGLAPAGRLAFGFRF